MVEVIRVDRASAVLTPSSLACLARLPTINLTAGCAHGCVYCYTRGYRSHPGDGRIVLYANTFEKLRDEFAKKRKKPQAVYFSPASDLFQPVPEVLELALEILDFLLNRHIGVAFLTKRTIPDRHMARLGRDCEIVRAQVGLISMNEQLAGAFEPGAAAPGVRLAQIRRLVQLGIKTQVRLDPILPGLTDDTDSLEALMFKVADAGVTDIGISVLFLRPAVVSSIKRRLQNEAMRKKLLACYEPCDRLSIHADNSTVLALPQDTRRRIYDRVHRAADRFGIRVRICACKNPDLARDSCRIAGDASLTQSTPRQLSLCARNERE